MGSGMGRETKTFYLAICWQKDDYVRVSRPLADQDYNWLNVAS